MRLLTALGVLAAGGAYVARALRTAARGRSTTRRTGAAGTRELLAHVTHELRTPLSGIIGGVRLLLDSDLSPAQRQHATTIRLCAEGLLHHIDDLLDLSRIEAGKLPLKPRRFAVRALLAESLRPLAPGAEAKDVLLAAEVADDVPEALVGDPDRLRQVLVNLVGNAIKFTDDGSVEVRIDVQERPGDTVVLRTRVRDTGIGIPADRLAAIFQPFTQGGEAVTGSRGGTGLGLAIASRLVEMMGGRLWAESTPGRGSTFSFTASLRAAPSGAARARPGLTGLRALVAEPNTLYRTALVDMLDAWGMQPAQAETGEEAVAAARRAHAAGTPFGVAFIAVDMVGTDGFSVAARLRSTPPVVEAIIMLTRAVARRGDRERCAELGIGAVLTRPFSPSDVYEALATALAVPAEPAPAGHPLRARRPLRILVADDSTVNSEITAAVLQGWGHQTVVAHDGRQALDTLEREAFDVAIVDLHMPGADGFEVVRRLREREAGRRRLPVVALTAGTMPGDADRCARAGMDGHLVKPVSAERLFATVESLTAPGRDAGFEAELLARAGGDASLRQRMAALFLAQLPGARERLRRALAGEEPRALAEAAHLLKGSVANFPGTRAAQAAEDVERLAGDGDVMTMQAAVGVLEFELERLADALAAIAERPV